MQSSTGNNRNIQETYTQLTRNLHATYGISIDILDLKIVQAIAEEKSQHEITKEVCFMLNKSSISRRLARLEKHGIIAEIKHTKPRFFTLSERGFFLLNKFLGGGADAQLTRNLGSTQKQPETWKVPFDDNRPNVIRLHRTQIVAGVLNPETLAKLPAILKERKYDYTRHNLKNWSQLTIKNFPTTDCTVQVNPRSISVFLPEIRGASVDEVMDKLLETYEKIIPVIEHDLKLDISKIRKVNVRVARQEIAFVGDKLAQAFRARGIRYYEVQGEGDNKAVIDNSKGTPEFEFHGRGATDSARDYETLERAFNPNNTGDFAERVMAGKAEALFDNIDNLPRLELKTDAILKLLGTYLGVYPAKNGTSDETTPTEEAPIDDTGHKFKRGYR